MSFLKSKKNVFLKLFFNPKKDKTLGKCFFAFNADLQSLKGVLWELKFPQSYSRHVPRCLLPCDGYKKEGKLTSNDV